jgi:hypothetical protein
MKVPWVLFAILLALCVVVGIVMTLAPGVGGGAVQHPTIPSMEQSGSRPESPEVLWIAAILGSLEILFFVGCLALGMRKREHLGRRAWTFVVGGFLYVGAFTVMMIAYAGFVQGDVTLVLSFPAPTAALIYLIWFVPGFFVVLYVVTFDRWVLAPEDLERFEKIVEARRKREGQVG